MHVHTFALFHGIPAQHTIEVRLYLETPEGDTVLDLPEVDARATDARVREALGTILPAADGLPSAHVTLDLPAGAASSDQDLAIAVGILGCMHWVDRAKIEAMAFVGALGAAGLLRAVEGIEALTRAAVRAGLRTLVLPRPNEAEARRAAIGSTLRIVALDQLKDVLSADVAGALVGNND